MYFLYKRLIIIILAITLCVSLSACFSPDVEEKTLEKPIVPDISTQTKTMTDVKIMLVTDDFVMESWPVIQALFELSGVNAYIKTVRPQSYKSYISKLLSTKDYFDLMEIKKVDAYNYRDDFVDISPVISNNAPDYTQWAMKYDDFSSAMSNQESIYYFPIRESTNKLQATAFSKDIIGDDNIVDINEFFSYMQSSSKKLSFKGSTNELIEIIAPYFGTSTLCYLDKGFVYGPISDEFKFMLSQLNTMYLQEILPKDFHHSPPSYYLDTVEMSQAGIVISKDEDYEWVYSNGYKPIMLDFNENSYAPSAYNIPDSYGVIPKGTTHEYIMIDFLQSCFSHEGRALLNYGIRDIHNSEDADGVISHLKPYTMLNSYQWHEQGLTPEGLPGIYYNEWSRFDEDLFAQIIPMKKYIAAKDFLMPPIEQNTNMKALTIAKNKVANAQQEWWSAFIVGSKSLDADWDEYLRVLTNSGYMIILSAEYSQ